MENKKHSIKTNKRSTRTKLIVATGGLLSVLAIVRAVPAQEPNTPNQSAPAGNQQAPSGGIVSDGTDSTGNLRMQINKTAVLTTKNPFKTVSTASSDIADVTTIGPTSILITAKKVGTTQIIVWDKTDHSQVIDVTVAFDLNAIQEQLKGMFPDSKIEVTTINGVVALRGRVPNLQVAEQAVAMASPYSPKVLNFLEVGGGQQVQLQVRFAEVSRSAVTNLGVSANISDAHSSFGTINGPGGTPIGALANRQTSTIDTGVTLFGSGQIGGTAFEAFLDAMHSNNLLRILAEPNLIAISGQEADFRAGGEIPIPVPQSSSGGGTTITIEYKEYGIYLKFIPIVLGDGRVRLKVSPEVSELDYANAVTLQGIQVPALTKRTVNTVVELADGQTFALAGLLNNRNQATSQSTPVLGDLPILGPLFRSVRYDRRETELVVMITPHLVAPLNADEVPMLPGEKWRNPTESDLLLNRDLGGEVDQDLESHPNVADKSPARFHGQYGFTPTTQPTTESDR